MHSATLLGFLLFSTVWASKTTQVGLSAGEASRSVHVPLDDCHDLDEEDVTSFFTKKKCMVFVGPSCTGRRVQLMPGDHSSEEPVSVGSVYCES